MKNIVTIILFVLSFSGIKASECYHYHTSKEHAMIKNERGVFYQFTEKDPNGISYVQQFKKPLKGIDLASYKYAGEDEATFMFSDKNGFYLLPKDGQYNDGDAKFFKILPNIAGQKHINGRLFYIDNKWTYLNAWEKHITKIVVKELPANISNIKCFSSGLYVKSDKQVFSISIDLYAKKYEIKTVPNLNPTQLIYYACNPSENEDFIADEKQIYAIRQDGSFEEITPQFLALGVKQQFNGLKLIPNSSATWWSNMLLKKREGHSVSGKNPLTGEDIDIYFSYSNATPLQPKYGEMKYVRFRNKIYPIWDDNFSQAYDVKTDASKLEAIEDKLFKGVDFYYFEADNDYKIINTNISAAAKFFPGLYGYRQYLSKALVDEQYIYFIGDRFSIHLEDKRKLTSKIVKQIGIFYLFNNALFDGEKSYPIQADYESLVSLGSFVEVIKSCAGEMPNTPQVAVKYHQFFRDKNSVYYFDEAGKKLQIIQTASVDDFTPDNYEHLQELYKIKDVKGSVKKKSIEPSVNYYAIVGGVIAVLVLGVLYFKRRKA